MQQRVTQEGPVPAWVLLPALAGGLSALGGGLWDDVWHTERGRDSFLIAPHIAIYAGITLVGWALTGWLLMTVRRDGLSAIRRQRPLLIAALGVAVTLASVPIDNFWHAAFGRDSVIWSPPHLLGIIGTGVLALALVLALSRSATGWRSTARWVAGGAAVAAFAFLTVEYDTDVPQFALLWHLPVLAVSSAFVLSLIRSATGDRHAATKSAAAHLVFVVLVSGFLLSQEFDAPRLPLLLLGAAVLDAAAPRRPRVETAMWFVVTLFVGYALAASVGWSGEDYALSDLVIGGLIAWPLVTVVLALADRSQSSIPFTGRRHTPVAVLLMALALPAAAIAHDPGQGEDAGEVGVTMRSVGQRVDVRATLPEGMTAKRLVARRAGDVRSGPLEGSQGAVSGSLELPTSGRWFMYLEMTRGGRPVEAWLPVSVGDRRSVVGDRSRFAYYADRGGSSAVQVVSSVILYGLVVALLGALVGLVRRDGPAPQAAV